MVDKTDNLLRTLTRSTKPAKKYYREINKLLGDHLSPKPLSIAERFRFHKRKQLDGESISDYVAVLRKLAEHCDFGDRLTDDLRDRLVCGMRNESIQIKITVRGWFNIEKGYCNFLCNGNSSKRRRCTTKFVVMVRDITPMNADLKRPYVISATKLDTLRRHAN